MENIYLLKYNNYYNRRIKRFANVTDYSPYFVAQINETANFNPGDGVTTTFVFNLADDINANYLLAVDVNDSRKFTRWFILDSVRLKSGQYRLELRRDLIADVLTDLYDAPMFIEKATLPIDNPLIFNSENMTFNQIKNSETLLKDGTECAWIVGYMARNDGSGNTTHISGSVSSINNQYISETTTTPSDFISQHSGTILNKSYLQFSTTYSYRNFLYYKKSAVYYTTLDGDTVNKALGKESESDTWKTGKELTDSQVKTNIFKNKWSEIIRLVSDANNFVNEENMNSITFYDGKKVKLSDGSVYEVKIKINEPIYRHIEITNMPNVEEYIDSTISQYLASLNIQNSTKSGNPYSDMTITTSNYFCSLTKVAEEGTFSYEIPISRNKVKDAPYDIFAIPYSPDRNNEPYVWISANDMGAEGAHLSSEIALLVAQNISEKWGATLYDLQLLPYCPLPELLSDPGTRDMSIVNLQNGIDFTLVKDSNNKIMSMIVFPNNSSFSTKIKLQNPIEIRDVKIESECDVYRLCSPNYQGVFEFNAAKNNGISYFDVDCTYLPYNPYIHISPNFGGLYGQDFNDSRGLICGGDFSLARISDAWTNYQLQNKNYMASFNRQIKSMEFNNNMALAGDIAGAVAGAFQGGLSGKYFGNVPGMISGGLASSVAGVTDVILNDQIRKEALDLTKDQFGYTLGNIKAIPDSLSKTTAYTANNKYFPFLEFYTCTDEEKEALRNKIKYDGMTVMKIGTLNEFVMPEETYIKGKLIMLENMDFDNHYVNELANELNKGFRIRKDEK